VRLTDLTNEQRLELKQDIVKDRNEHIGEGTSYEELANADELVDDEVLQEAYDGTEFTSDDFCCGEAADRDGVLDELQEWAERELTDRNFAKSKGMIGPIHLHEHVGIEWARQFLLEHIKAVRP
jgi:hypothetical protein